VGYFLLEMKVDVLQNAYSRSQAYQKNKV